MGLSYSGYDETLLGFASGDVVSEIYPGAHVIEEYASPFPSPLLQPRYTWRARSFFREPVARSFLSSA